MPEDEGEDGDVANDRLIELFKSLGWSHHGKSDIDIPCTSGVHTDRVRDHGVDGYMTYEDPFRKLERGVFIESKYPQWDSIFGSDIDNYMKQTIGTMECAPEADAFQSRLNDNTDRNWDAGIIGVFSKDEFHQADFERYVSEVNVRGKERGSYEIAVLGNHDLHRLTRLANEYNQLKQDYDGEKETLEFFYPSMVNKPFPSQLDVLTFEYVLSDIVFARLEKPHTVDGEFKGWQKYNIVFYFGDMSVDSLRLVFKCLVEYSMLEGQEIWMYYDGKTQDGGLQDLRSSISQFKNNVIPEEAEKSVANIPEFKFRRMSEESFESYTDKLIGEFS